MQDEPSVSMATRSHGNDGQGTSTSFNTDTGTMASRDSDGDLEKGVVDVAGTAPDNALAPQMSGMRVWGSNTALKHSGTEKT